MIKKVLPKDSPILKRSCATVVNFEKIKPVIQDIIDTIEYSKTIHKFTRGIGLAAPQIGESLKISVVENTHGQRYTLINPEIIEKSKTRKPIREGCISFLEYRALVPRYDYVKIQATDENGKSFTLEGFDDFAMLLQHEIDHLNGILYFDHLPNGEKDLFII
ncbi:MAG: peptide deformylase [Candidatus Magasanikbacteria bacterium]